MLKDLLQEDRYKFVDKRLDEYYPEFEELYSFGFVGAELFDELTHLYLRIPTQEEFLEVGLDRAREFFQKQPIQWLSRSRVNHTFKWDYKLINCVENRLSRSYISFIIEAQVTEMVRANYHTKVAGNTLIDVVFGSDVTVLKGDKIFYIHITKNNQWSSEFLRTKGSKSTFVIDSKGERRYWKRNWKQGHHLLTYNNKWQERMINVNGNTLFDEDWLEEWLDDMFDSKNYDSFNGKSELASFYKYMNRFNLAGSEVKSA